MNKILIQGNWAIGEAAIRAGCRFYTGYPITPQNELTEYMADHMRKAALLSRPKARSRPASMR